MSTWRPGHSAALLAAWVFTDATLDLLGLSPDRFQIPVAVLWALTGENLLRRALDLSASETAFADLLKMWRGK